MTTLLRLYPRSWRDRYEAEFIDLLAVRPPTIGDRVDILRGAIDARLHPQVRQAGTPEPGGLTVSDRNAGYLAIVGGALWVIAAVGIATATDVNEAGYPALLSIFVALGGLLFGLAAYIGASARVSSWTVARASAVAMAIGAILVILPWPILVPGIFGLAIGGIMFGLATAVHSRSAVGLVIAVASAFFLVAALGFVPLPAGLLPLGVAWAVAGATRLAGRRSFAWA